MLQKPSKKNIFPSDMMSLERMGCRYPSRLSFSRSMLRRMVKENWHIDRVRFELDKDGYGCAIYEVKITKQLYSLICFSQYIDEGERSDRVIAEKWDTSYALLIGKISTKDFERLKTNIPLQEAGRNSSKELVISRANKSIRLFEKVVCSLSKGLQPEIRDINDVGYLLRTTAVYGSGKFGLSDFMRTENVTHFNQPFRAEMLAVYLVREFSVHLVEHIAFHRNPKKAVKLKKNIKQHLGIGNSTGLGMAPFVIKHPKLIHKWINQFENALKKIKQITSIENNRFEKYLILLLKAQTYLSEVLTYDKLQKEKNKQSYKDIKKIIKFCKTIKNKSPASFNWNDIITFAKINVCFDVQEIVKVQILELYPNITDPLAEDMSISDDLFIDSDSKVDELNQMIKKNYNWAININFNKKDNTYLFWYVSEEKLEPRLGERYNEPGASLEQPLGIGKMVNDLYKFINNLDKQILSLTIAEFLLLYPEYRGIVRRIQTLANFKYGEIRDNILAKTVRPINMLRFKLSFFGASRYDPKSDRWVRVSFFPGAPFYNDLNQNSVEDWGFATMNSYH